MSAGARLPAAVPDLITRMENRIMEKIPCNTCGVPILPTTAQRNDGQCMPCANGTRETMGRSRQKYREYRARLEADPRHLYWDGLCSRAYGTPDGYDRLPPREKLYFAACLLAGDVISTGFDAAFRNTGGERYATALRCLEEIGAVDSIRILEAARQIVFGFGGVPASAWACDEAFERLTPGQEQRLEELDRQFRADPDGLHDRFEAFALRHGLYERPAGAPEG
jgi:hypothetical protein